MTLTITKEVDVEIDDILEDIRDDDLREFGLRRICDDDERREDSIMGVLRAVSEHHDKAHRTNSMLACPDEPCTSFNTSEIMAIDEARQSHWGRSI